MEPLSLQVVTLPWLFSSPQSSSAVLILAELLWFLLYVIPCVCHGGLASSPFALHLYAGSERCEHLSGSINGDRGISNCQFCSFSSIKRSIKAFGEAGCGEKQVPPG